MLTASNAFDRARMQGFGPAPSGLAVDSKPEVGQLEFNDQMRRFI